MKRTCYFVIMCMLLLLAGCTKTASTEAELLQILAKEESVPSSSELKIIGKVEEEGAILVCALATDDNQVTRYYAAEFKTAGQGYKFSHSHMLLERGADIFTLNWRNGFIFICNNPNANKIQLDFLDGDVQEVPITGNPFFYYYPYSNEDKHSFSYLFLDEDDQIVS